MCEHGLLKLDKWGKHVLCGPRSLNSGKGYECIVHPTARYGVCCPVTELLLIPSQPSNPTVYLMLNAIRRGFIKCNIQ